MFGWASWSEKRKKKNGEAAAPGRPRDVPVCRRNARQAAPPHPSPPAGGAAVAWTPGNGPQGPEPPAPRRSAGRPAEPVSPGCLVPGAAGKLTSPAACTLLVHHRVPWAASANLHPIQVNPLISTFPEAEARLPLGECQKNPLILGMDGKSPSTGRLAVLHIVQDCIPRVLFL